MTKLVAWRVSNRTWSKWHYLVDGRWTICGKEIPPQEQWGGPITSDTERPELVAGICATCTQHSRPHLPVSA